METEWLKSAADIGYPLAILAALVWAGRKMWSDLWPWFRDTYWAAREVRWKEIHDAQVAREAQYKSLTEDYLATIRRYENGHRSKSAEEHQAIVREIRAMGNNFAELNQSVMGQVDGWRKDTLHLVTLSEQRADAMERLLQKIEQALSNGRLPDED